MIAFFSELDGTTWQQELPESMLMPEIHFPIYPFPRFSQVALALANTTFKARRYKRVGISRKIAFYDRIVDAEEIR